MICNKSSFWEYRISSAGTGELRSVLDPVISIFEVEILETMQLSGV